MSLIVRCVAPAEGAGIARQWAARRIEATRWATQAGLTLEGYPAWDWERWIARGIYLCFGLFDEMGAVEALAACRPAARGLEMFHLQTAPDNYYALREERACVGAGRALAAALARVCQLRAGDEALLVGRDALLESIPFYDRLGFERASAYDPRERLWPRIELRIPPLAELIAQHYTAPGITGAEDVFAATFPAEQR